jgi:hypothetical protein
MLLQDPDPLAEWIAKCEVGIRAGLGAMAAMDSNVGPEFQRWIRNWQH